MPINKRIVNRKEFGLLFGCLAGVFEGIEEKSGEGAELWHEAHSFETS